MAVVLDKEPVLEKDPDPADSRAQCVRQGMPLVRGIAEGVALNGLRRYAAVPQVLLRLFGRGEVPVVPGGGPFEHPLPGEQPSLRDLVAGLAENEIRCLAGAGSGVKFPHKVDCVTLCAADAAAEKLRVFVCPQRPVGSQVERAAQGRAASAVRIKRAAGYHVLQQDAPVSLGRGGLHGQRIITVLLNRVSHRLPEYPGKRVLPSLACLGCLRRKLCPGEDAEKRLLRRLSETSGKCVRRRGWERGNHAEDVAEHEEPRAGALRDAPPERAEVREALYGGRHMQHDGRGKLRAAHDMLFRMERCAVVKSPHCRGGLLLPGI